MGVCLNELEGVVFTLSRDLRRVSPLRGAHALAAISNLSSHGHAPLQAKKFGIEISSVA